MWKNYFILLILILTYFMSFSSARQRQINIGRFKSYAHDLKSGSVTLLDTRRILIRNFYYDGTGPDAWFSIGQKSTGGGGKLRGDPKERDDLTNNAKIADENGSCGIVKKYNGKNIILTLPNDLTFSNVDYISLYCYKYQHNFGYVKIPNNLNGLYENKENTRNTICN